VRNELRQARAATDGVRAQAAELKQELSAARDEIHLLKTRLRASEAARDDALAEKKEAETEVATTQRKMRAVQSQLDAMQLKSIALEKALSASSAATSPSPTKVSLPRLY
jgi:chromosome segregation ATPase